MGFLQYDPKPMEEKEAEQLLASGTYFDYLKGRVMKIRLSGDEVSTSLYNRDNGPGAAEAAVDALRRSGNTNTVEIQASHVLGKVESAQVVRDNLGKETTTSISPSGIARVELGFNDVADTLREALDKS